MFSLSITYKNIVSAYGKCALKMTHLPLLLASVTSVLINDPTLLKFTSLRFHDVVAIL
jgi:hypothetical protein